MGGSKNSKGANLSLLRQHQNMKEMTHLSKVKQNIHKDKSCNLKTQKDSTGLCELYLLTVSIEKVARCQYKTVLIIFPLNLQAIT